MSESEIYYHYCGLSALHDIIRYKALRLSNLFFMNDSMEVSWFFDIARNSIKQHLGRVDDHFTQNDDEDDNEALVELLSLLEKRQFDHIYAACFSSKRDDLSQWRGYADDGRGVTIGVDLEKLVRLSGASTLKFTPVTYEEEKQKSVVEDLLEPLFDIESSASSSSSTGTGTSTSRAVRVFRELAQQAPAFKNHAFSSEKEFRLIVRTKVPPDSDESPDQWDDCWSEGFPSPIDFYQTHGRLIPFTEIDFPTNDVIRSVGLGPRFGLHENEVAIRLFLDKELGGTQIDLYRSKASYR